MKAIIIEDIKYEAELFASYLNKFFPMVEIVGIADNVDDAILIIIKHRPDFVLMDIEIIGGTSYDILDKLQKSDTTIDFEIIFMTGHLNFEYATAAFEYSALDFLTKPIDLEHFKKAVNKALEKGNPQQYLKQLNLFLDLVRSNDSKFSRIAVHKIGGEIELINIDSVNYLEADREITIFHLKNNSTIKASKNLGHYANILTATHDFFSISQSFLISLTELKSYDHSDKKVVLNDKTILYASRRCGQELKSYINNLGFDETLNNEKKSFLSNFFHKVFR